MTIFVKSRTKSTSRFTYASEGYAEQLRTVHFALLSVSAGLLLLVFSAKPYDSRQAVMQMDGILKLKSQWSPKWIVDHERNQGQRVLDRFIAPDVPADTARLLKESAADSNQEAIVKLTPKSNRTKPLLFRLTAPSERKEFIWLDERDTRSLDHVPDRLDLFAKWWNELTHNHIFLQIDRIGQQCHETSAKPKFAKCEVLYDELLDNKDTVKLLNTNATATYSQRFRLPKVSLLGGDELTGELKFDVVSYVIVNVWQGHVFDLFPQATKDSVPGKDFATSFPDLNLATSGIQSLDLDSVSRYLQTNSNASEVFEAFGLKIASEQVTTWGTVVILCIQLYLYVYLRGFKNPLEPSDKAWDVGWFAVNDGLLPRTIFFITVFLLPAITVVILTRRAFVHHLTKALAIHMGVYVGRSRFAGLVLAFTPVLISVFPWCISVMLGYLSWHNRPRVVREAATSRSQLFE